jgi:hypothetical protein
VRPLILGAVSLLLGACVNNAQLVANTQASDDAECRSYGVDPGSPGYVQCRMNLENQRTALASAFIASGGLRH